MIKRCLQSALALLIISTTAGCTDSGQSEREATSASAIRLEQVVVRATLPGMTNTAAYMTIRNTSDKPMALVSVHSDLATKTELHTHRMENGVMKMQAIPSLAIAPHSAVQLQPGGDHIMLMGLQPEGIVEGRNVPLALTFADGTVQSIEVTAQRKTPE